MTSDDDSANRPFAMPCPVEVRDAFAKLYSEHVLSCLDDCFRKATAVDAQFSECTDFQLLQREFLNELERRDEPFGHETFWSQVNQLLILISRSESRSVLRLVDGIMHAVARTNELALALLARSFIEHACAVCWTSCKVAAHARRLQSEIWPSNCSATVIDDDRRLRDDLMKFALGARTSVDGLTPPDNRASQSQWQKYRKSSEHAVPEELRAEQVLDQVDFLSKQADYRDIRATYDRLSEYCHPNAASRTLDFRSHSDEPAMQTLTLAEGTAFTVGFITVFDAVRTVLPRLSDRLDQDLEVLANAAMPMAPVANRPSGSIPPPGTICAVDMQTARVLWVKSDQLHATSVNPATLTDDQKRRIRKIADAFAAVSNRTPETWLDLFAKNMNVEREIQLSERMAKVFTQELAKRPGASPRERSLLFLAVNEGVSWKNLGDLLSTRPELKSLPNLERVFEQLRTKADPA